VRKVRKVNVGYRVKGTRRTARDAPIQIPCPPNRLRFYYRLIRSEYQFKTAGMRKTEARTALMIDFASVDRRSNAELIEDPSGHDDCFDWSGHIASRGRIWVDARKL